MLHENPAGQRVHLVEPAKAYCPNTHAVGATDVEAHEDPAGQRVHLVEPARAYSPEEQAEGDRSYISQMFHRPYSRQMRVQRVMTRSTLQLMINGY